LPRAFYFEAIRVSPVRDAQVLREAFKRWRRFMFLMRRRLSSLEREAFGRLARHARRLIFVFASTKNVLLKLRGIEAMRLRRAKRAKLTKNAGCAAARLTSAMRVALPCAGAFALAAPARAADLLHEIPLESEVVGLALSGGLALFSAVVAVAHLTERKSWRRRELALEEELNDARAGLDRAQSFLSSEAQIFIAWDGPDGEPDIEGSPLLVTDFPAPRRVLGFGSWLTPASAAGLERALDRLRERGEAFRQTLIGLTGRHFDAEGRAVGGRAVLRIREISGDRLELINLRLRFDEALAETKGLRALLQELPEPAWLRDADGRLAFVNAAYVRAVEAKDADDALRGQVELLDQAARDAAAKACDAGGVWRDRTTGVVAGARHALDVTQTRAGGVTGAVAIDRHETETMRADYEEQMRSHARTLDQLPTAVAIFDRSQRLIYRNAAYNELWPLSAAFLDQRPTDSEILDQLRAHQRLPVEADYKVWKARLLDAYRGVEQQFHVWHTPNGRTLRVVVHPNPQGGVTYLYDDMSERYDLESRFNALYRMQNETLETLHEGVAVFGTDGRLKFSNPAFARLWRLQLSALAERPHFETIVDLCRDLYAQDAVWDELRGFVTGLHDMRLGFTRRMERSDGVVLDFTAQPLPEGAALLTFVDVTADANVERALTDRNKALLAAERLRNDFIHHVSYELRSPLNNINGFVHLLGEESTGDLNPRQREYLGYVSKSSAALLAIIDDILDLATIDEGAMALEVDDVDVDDAMRGAIEGVQDRLSENEISLEIVSNGDIGSFRGDPKRVRQILFNLLSNAIGFSRPGQAVTLAVLRRENEVVFKVVDRGRGIPAEVLERVFEPFESHTAGTRHRGVGLGLSIVRAFMELHGGRVTIDSAPGEGTMATCIFPAPAEQATSDEAPIAKTGERGA
jgi:signal transduction histidine kinase